MKDNYIISEIRKTKNILHHSDFNVHLLNRINLDNNIVFQTYRIQYMKTNLPSIHAILIINANYNISITENYFRISSDCFESKMKLSKNYLYGAFGNYKDLKA